MLPSAAYYVSLWEVSLPQDTVTGFLLAGVGNVDLRRKSNFLVVTESKLG